MKRRHGRINKIQMWDVPVNGKLARKTNNLPDYLLGALAMGIGVMEGTGISFVGVPDGGAGPAGSAGWQT